MEVWNCLDGSLQRKWEGAKIARSKMYNKPFRFLCHEMKMKWLIDKIESIDRLIQSINQLANHSQSTNEPINQLINQAANQPINPSNNQQDNDSSPKSTSKSPWIIESFHPSRFFLRKKKHLGQSNLGKSRTPRLCLGELDDWKINANEWPALLTKANRTMFKLSSRELTAGKNNSVLFHWWDML